MEGRWRSPSTSLRGPDHVLHPPGRGRAGGGVGMDPGERVVVATFPPSLGRFLDFWKGSGRRALVCRHHFDATTILLLGRVLSVHVTTAHSSRSFLHHDICKTNKCEKRYKTDRNNGTTEQKSINKDLYPLRSPITPTWHRHRSASGMEASSGGHQRARGPPAHWRPLLASARP